MTINQLKVWCSLRSSINSPKPVIFISFFGRQIFVNKNRGYPFHGICMHLLHIFTQEIWFSQWDFGGFTQIFKPRSLGNLYSPLQSHLWHCGSWDSQRTNQSHQVFRWQCLSLQHLGSADPELAGDFQDFPPVVLMARWKPPINGDLVGKFMHGGFSSHV